MLLQEFSQNTPSKQSERFSIPEIRDTIHDLQAADFYPNVVFVPSEFFHEVFEWNQQQRQRIPHPISNPMHSLIIDPTTILKVKYSSRYAEFDNVIITTKEANLWQYRQDIETGERITAKFDWNQDDPQNTSLLVKTIFNFQIKSDEANIVLELPHTSQQTKDNDDNQDN